MGQTHRQHAHGVIFVTGQARTDGTPMHWSTMGAAAAQGLTLVIYIGVTSIMDIGNGLLASLPGATPAALVQNASLPNQRHTVCTLGSLVTEQRAEGAAARPSSWSATCWVACAAPPNRKRSAALPSRPAQPTPHNARRAARSRRRVGCRGERS